MLFIVFANYLVIIPPQKVLQRYALYKESRGPFNLMKKKNLSNSVFFLKTVSNPQRNHEASFYIQNPLSFDGDVLFVKDLKEKNSELKEYYPAKEFYMYEFDQTLKNENLVRLK